MPEVLLKGGGELQEAGTCAGLYCGNGSAGTAGTHQRFVPSHTHITSDIIVGETTICQIEGVLKRRREGGSGCFDLDLVSVNAGAIELGDDGVGVIGQNIDEEMALADIHGSDDVGGKAGFA